jgi:hypothetical protein
MDRETKLDKDLENLIRSLEKEEVDDKIPEYQVWLIGLDETDSMITDDLVASYTDPKEAIRQAELYTAAFDKYVVNVNPDVRKYEVVVETVLNFEDYEENIATLYSETIKL